MTKTKRLRGSLYIDIVKYLKTIGSIPIYGVGLVFTTMSSKL